MSDRHAALVRIWLKQLAALMHDHGWRIAFQRGGALHLEICMGNHGDAELWLRTQDQGTRWSAHVAGVPGAAKL